MGRRSKDLTFYDFTGGLNTDDAPTSLEINQAIDLDNIVFLPKTGFKKRNGNSLYNSGSMDGSVHGLGYYKTITNLEYLMSIAGSKIYKSEFDGTMDDITGATSISPGQDNIWINNQMNDLSIFVGGNRSTDVPIKWNGSGNAQILGGTPPVGSWGISANNRFFIANTIAAPSRINWSILGNPEDWSGAGSGSQDVSNNDGDSIVGGVLLATSHLLIFKQNSIHELVLNSSPFPLFPLFSKVGAISSRAILDIDGVCYFITPQARMKATDGTSIVEFPDVINTVWDGLNKSRLPYIQGVYDKVRRLVLWFCSDADSQVNNIVIIWDLVNKVWNKFTSGHEMNAAMVMRDTVLYGGGYDSNIYRLDDPNTTVDASDGSVAINSFWRSGWLDMSQMINMKHIPYVDLNFRTQTSGSFDFSYGYDFDSDRNTVNINMQAVGGLWDSGVWDVSSWGGVTDKTKFQFLKGNGKFFQFCISNDTSVVGDLWDSAMWDSAQWSGADQRFQFNRMSFPVNMDAPLASR